MNTITKFYLVITFFFLYVEICLETVVFQEELVITIIIVSFQLGVSNLIRYIRQAWNRLELYQSFVW